MRYTFRSDTVKPYDTRIVEGFLLLPKTLERKGTRIKEFRWLEKTRWIEFVTTYGSWTPFEWAD